MGLLDIFSLGNLETVKNILGDKKEVKIAEDTADLKGSFYDFTANSLDGKRISFKDYTGKKIVVINVASKCGYTPQYEDWQEFHKKYGEKVIVLGFPANNFLSQESGTNGEIATFCQKNYGVTFQMFEKLDVIGDAQHPLYKWLSTKDLNGWNDQAPTWNFCKYIINEKGKLTHFFASKITPESKEFKQAIGLQ